MSQQSPKQTCSRPTRDVHPSEHQRPCPNNKPRLPQRKGRSLTQMLNQSYLLRFAFIHYHGWTVDYVSYIHRIHWDWRKCFDFEKIWLTCGQRQYKIKKRSFVYDDFDLGHYSTLAELTVCTTFMLYECVLTKIWTFCTKNSVSRALFRVDLVLVNHINCYYSMSRS